MLGSDSPLEQLKYDADEDEDDEEEDKNAKFTSAREATTREDSKPYSLPSHHPWIYLLLLEFLQILFLRL